MRKRIVIIAAIGTFCACGNSSYKYPEMRSVVLTTPKQIESTNIKYYSGIVCEAHIINLGFKTPGQIERIHVHEGNFVRQGELLAELDTKDYQLGVEALQIQYDQLRNEVKRLEQLFEQKSVSVNDYEKALAGLKQLGVQLEVNKNKLHYTKLYAPTDGYIQNINFSPAEMVDAGTSVFTLLDVSQMEVTADIPLETYLQRNRFLGYHCSATGLSKEYPMKFSSLTPKADGNQLYRLRLTFAERPDERLTAGMNIEVAITITNTDSTTRYALPLHAVFHDGNAACVWILEADSTISKRQVVLDQKLDDKGEAIVIGGLTGQEQIVRAGVNALQEGERVRIIESPSKTNVGGVL